MHGGNDLAADNQEKKMAQLDRSSGLVGNAALKYPCRAATTANITLSGEQTIDGIACVADDRVLVKNQTTGSENGIWVVATGSWNRADDFDGSYDCTTGTMVRCVSGTTNANSVWKLDTTGTITIGTTSLTFTAASVGFDAQGMADFIHAATTKATPIDADEFGYWDSVASLFKKLTFANLKTTLGLTFAALAGSASQAFAASTLTSTGGALNGTLGAITPASVAGTTGTFSGAFSSPMLFSSAAVADDATDNGTVINAEITAHQSVFIPSGTSRTTTALALSNNRMLMGIPQESVGSAGTGASIIKSSATKIIDCGSGSNASVRLKGLQLKPVTNLVSGTYGIYGTGQVFGQYEDIDIRNMDTAVYQAKSQQTRFNRMYITGNNYGMLFYAAAGTFNVDWFNNIISIENSTVKGSLLGPNIDFQGQGLHVINTDISAFPTSGTRAAIRVRASSYNVNIDSVYFEGLQSVAGGDVFLCEGGTTIIDNAFIGGGATGTRFGSIVSASGGAIVIVNGIRGYDYFTNLVKADGAGTVVYLMPGSIKGSLVFTTEFSETNGGRIVDLRNISTGYTVATLPTSGLTGMKTYVTDATAPTYLGALTGGGAVKCPVFYNGSAWVSG